MRNSTRRDLDTVERFSERYGVSGSRAGLIVERAVIGGNVGANGYTTVRQAGRLARSLRLRRGVRLLDVGAGRGWPGIYLAEKTGCAVVLADVPRPALLNARKRARKRRVSRRAACVVASALAPPFRPASFDAIVHTDVAC